MKSERGRIVSIHLWSLVVPSSLWFSFIEFDFPTIAAQIAQLGANLPIYSMAAWQLCDFLNAWPVVIAVVLGVCGIGCVISKFSTRVTVAVCAAATASLIATEACLSIPFRILGAAN